MDSKWVNGHEDKEKRKKQVLSYRPAFNELKEILEKHYIKKDAVRDYSPGWEYKQVAVNEYNQVLQDLLKLIDIKE